MSDFSYTDLFMELEAYENRGVKICLNDAPASPYQVTRAYMQHGACDIMRDYIADGGGHICELHFYPLASSSDPV